jgi:uncharacterized membrane protein YkgB
VYTRIDRIEHQITAWMQRWGLTLLRYSLGAVFIWFGILKVFDLSPAEPLIEQTVFVMSLNIPLNIFVPLLGILEVTIGICLLFRPLLRLAILLLFLQMPGTILPLFMLPEMTFTQVPYAPTMEGQYIIKNLVLISAGIVIGGTARFRNDEGVYGVRTGRYQHRASLQR